MNDKIKYATIVMLKVLDIENPFRGFFFTIRHG